MLSVLAKSIREYKKPSLLAPLLVSGEVVMECIIPFVTANLVNQIKAGCSIGVIVQYGAVLVVMAGLPLTFGALAGSACATASCGFARNLRKDMFYKIQDYSFENIDKFSVSSLVTRMTTDVTNVQMAYMMIVRTAIRCPLMLVFSFAMAFIMGGKMAVIFLLVIPVLGVGLALGYVNKHHGFWAGVLLHGLYNAAVLVLSSREIGITLPIVLVCTIAFIFAWRGLMQEEEPHHEADGTGL